jgi:hypothetical protein
LLQALGFGIALTDYEQALIESLRDSLPPAYRAILDDQLSRFNRVVRLLHAEEELDFGHVSFYWIQSGKTRLDLPLLFPWRQDEYLLATLEVHSAADPIYVRFMLVRGVFFTIEFRSTSRRYTPLGAFELKSVSVFVDGSGDTSTSLPQPASPA